jgi:hypothetical protein
LFLRQRSGTEDLGLDDLAGFEATGAHATCANAPVFLNADRLQIRQKTPFRDGGGVQTDAAFTLLQTMPHDAAARARAFSTDVTLECHTYSYLKSAGTIRKRLAGDKRKYAQDMRGENFGKKWSGKARRRQD